jgi:hypothetical protein
VSLPLLLPLLPEEPLCWFMHSCFFAASEMLAHLLMLLLLLEFEVASGELEEPDELEPEDGSAANAAAGATIIAVSAMATRVFFMISPFF